MKKILIFISLETYLRNWIDAKAFNSIESNFEILYVIPEYDWEIKNIEKYGVTNYKVIKQPEFRKKLFRRILAVTMFRHSNKSVAFKIKTSYFSKKASLVYKLLSSNLFFHPFLFLCKLFLGRWNEFNDLLESYNPDLIIAPSLMADSFTIDMTYTANLNNKKSLILINSWDNLISKGVIPIQPTHIGVWGNQAMKQAMEVQNVPENIIKILGVPRFEQYGKNSYNSELIYKSNNIPENKKIILYACTSLPFDDLSALILLNNEILTNPNMKDYIILFRPHPEMMWRKDERNVLEEKLENVYIDNQLANFYKSRFLSADKSFSSSINKTDLSYYPSLLNSIVAMVCPATTLALEGLINGKPCLMICYNDGKNFYLSPDQLAKYENVKEVLNLEGVLPCFSENDLIPLLHNLIVISIEPNYKSKIIRDTQEIVFTDDTSYSDRLLNYVNDII